MKKGIPALICMILMLMFIVVTLFGPWYGISDKSGMVASGYVTNVNLYESTLYLTSATTTSYQYNSDFGKVNQTTQTMSYTDARKQAELAGGDTSLFDIFNITFYLAIFALIIAISALVSQLGYVFNFGKPNTMRKLAMIFCSIAFILIIVVVLYFAVTVPGAMKSGLRLENDIGFWYSYSDVLSVGPGYSWYLMLIGAILAFVSFIFIFVDKRGINVKISESKDSNFPIHKKRKDYDNLLEIIKLRYAKGEITKEEFEQMKKDIEQ